MPVSKVSSNLTGSSAMKEKSSLMPLRLLAVLYRAEVASCLTLVSLISLSVRPVALTLSLLAPMVAILTALLKKDALMRLVPEL